MIEQIITDIHDLTIDMEKLLVAEKFEEFADALEKRKILMLKVEAYKKETPNFEYSAECKQKLEATFQRDQLLLPKAAEQKEKLGSSLAQVKKQKKISQKYSPVIKQNYGAFIDTNK